MIDEKILYLCGGTLLAIPEAEKVLLVSILHLCSAFSMRFQRHLRKRCNIFLLKAL